MIDHVRAALSEARQALDRLMQDDGTLAVVAQAGALLAHAFQTGGKVYSCGNGGSMCDAMHFAEELTGRFRKDRMPFPAQAIADAAHMSCTANDYGYDDVFARYIVAHGRAGDVLLAISTSGKSPNVVKAAQQARSSRMKVIALTGQKPSVLGQLADVEICTPGGQFADRVQELHIKVIHILIELIERHFKVAKA